MDLHCGKALVCWDGESYGQMMSGWAWRGAAMVRCGRFDATRARLAEARGEMHLRPRRPAGHKAPKGQLGLW